MAGGGLALCALALLAAAAAWLLWLGADYDSRHPNLYACAPYEDNTGRQLFPCDHGAVYYTSPGLLELALDRVTGQPEPTPRAHVTP